MEDTFKAIELGLASINTNRSALIRALVLPVVIYLGIVILIQQGVVSEAGAKIINFLLVVPISLIAITTHRIVLRGPESIPKWGINRIGWREIKFALSQYVILLFLIPAGLLFLIPYIGWLCGILLGAYMVGRLSLVFPSIAVDEKLDFVDSWYSTKEYQFMMFGVVAVFPFILGVFEFMLSRIRGLEMVLHALSIVTTVFTVAALSAAFKIIREPKSVR